MSLIRRLGRMTSLCIGIVLAPIFVPLLVAVVFISKYVLHNSKPKVVWGPIPIINIRYNSHAVRARGYISDTIVYNVNDINTRKDFDYVIHVFKNPLLHSLSVCILSYPVFLFVVLKYDIFQFYFNGGYLSGTPIKWLELPILKFAGKKIVVSPYGGDVTQPSKVKDKYRWNIAMFYTDDYEAVDEKKVRRNIDHFTKYADVIIGVGELLEYLPWYDVILPMNSTIDLAEWTITHKNRSDPIKIVHAPNHRALKGTSYLIDTCNELEEEGYRINLTLIERMSNKDAKKIYEQADIIADQFLIGWYALFAAEGMALGKPVMCYLRDDLMELNKHLMTGCPVVNTSPDNLKDNLRGLLNDEKLCVRLGKQGREYVEKYGMKYVGEQLDILYSEMYKRC